MPLPYESSSSPPYIEREVNIPTTRDLQRIMDALDSVVSKYVDKGWDYNRETVCEGEELLDIAESRQKKFHGMDPQNFVGELDKDLVSSHVPPKSIERARRILEFAEEREEIADRFSRHGNPEKAEESEEVAEGFREEAEFILDNDFPTYEWRGISNTEWNSFLPPERTEYDIGIVFPHTENVGRITIHNNSKKLSLYGEEYVEAYSIIDNIHDEISEEFDGGF